VILNAQRGVEAPARTGQRTGRQKKTQEPIPPAAGDLAEAHKAAARVVLGVGVCFGFVFFFHSTRSVDCWEMGGFVRGWVTGEVGCVGGLGWGGWGFGGVFFEVSWGGWGGGGISGGGCGRGVPLFGPFKGGPQFIESIRCVSMGGGVFAGLEGEGHCCYFWIGKYGLVFLRGKYWWATWGGGGRIWSDVGTHTGTIRLEGGLVRFSVVFVGRVGGG